MKIMDDKKDAITFNEKAQSTPATDTKVVDHTPKELHMVVAKYEILTTDEDKAIEEVRKIFERNRDVRNVSIRLSLTRNTSIFQY